jgi:hypothetical protein
MPKFGPDLSFLDFGSYTYFTRPRTRKKIRGRSPRNHQEYFLAFRHSRSRAKIPLGRLDPIRVEVVYHNMLDPRSKRRVSFSFRPIWRFRCFPTSSKSTSTPSFPLPITSSAPSMARFGRAVPLFMFRKAFISISRFNPISGSITRKPVSSNGPSSLR